MNPTCHVDGCSKPTRRRTAALCAMHYHRQYRHGDVHKAAPNSGVSAKEPRRYRLRHLPSHPLASKNGNVYVHRQVLYDLIGNGPHTCHWCGTEVHWAKRGQPNALIVDHLDGDGSNNDPHNLAPTCNGCNSGRGGQRRSALLRDHGWWSNNDTIAKLGHRRAPIEP